MRSGLQFYEISIAHAEVAAERQCEEETSMQRVEQAGFERCTGGMNEINGERIRARECARGQLNETPTMTRRPQLSSSGAAG